MNFYRINKTILAMESKAIVVIEDKDITTIVNAFSEIEIEANASARGSNA